jgi:HD-like signal output (HDOD) protein
MEPIAFELSVDAQGNAAPGNDMLAAFVPGTDKTPAVVLLAGDPRHETETPISDLIPAAMAHTRQRMPEAVATAPLWSVIDSFGRFNEAIPDWEQQPIPSVKFRAYPRGTNIEAFFDVAGAAGEAAIELLSAAVESPNLSEVTPTEREFLESVEIHGNLPSPGAIFHKVNAAAANGDAREIAHVIQTEPVISLSLINSANAARFAAAARIASVPQAVNRLGTSFVCRVVFIAEMVARYQKGACPDFDYRAYWMNSIAAAASMKPLMANYDIPEQSADDAFTVGLVAGIGWLVIAETFPALMSKYVARCRGADPITKARAQREIFPCSIRRASERYLERYAFPKVLQHAVGGDMSGGNNWFDCLAQAVRVAQGLAPFECVAIPTTIPVPDACREEWNRWKDVLMASR